MKYSFIVLMALLSLNSCVRKNELSSTSPVNWETRLATTVAWDSLVYGSTYLPAYSEIYQLHEHKTYNLTVTASLRNISLTDTIYILKADYYNTAGDRVRSYLKSPIFIKPLETIEIVIDETDRQGGTGGNFIFNWATKSKVHEPLFEAVMISTTGQQGLSFTTRGVRISD